MQRAEEISKDLLREAAGEGRLQPGTSVLDRQAFRREDANSAIGDDGPENEREEREGNGGEDSLRDRMSAVEKALRRIERLLQAPGEKSPLAAGSLSELPSQLLREGMRESLQGGSKSESGSKSRRLRRSFSVSREP